MRGKGAPPEVHARLNPRNLMSLALIALLILGLLAFAAWQEHHHAIDRAELEAEKLTRLLALEVDDLFRDVDELQQALTRLLPSPGEGQASGDSVDEWLRTFADSITGLDGLSIFNATGELRHSSFVGLESLNIADRRHFQTLREDREQQSTFTALLTERTANKPSLVQLRALRNEQGQFLGVIAAVIGLERIGNLLREANVDPKGVALLRRSDTSALIARHPSYDEADLNRPLPLDNPIRKRVMAGERSGELRYTASTDGVKRVGSFRVLDDYPFYVQVAVSEEHALVDWWRRAGLLSGMAALLILGSLLVLGRLQRIQQRAEANARALEAQKAAAYRFREMLLASLGEGVFGLDTEGRYTFLNPMACRLLGFTDEAQALGLGSHATSHHSRPDGTHFPEQECPIYGVLQTGEPMEAWEDTFWSHDGRAFPVLVYAAPMYGDEGGVAGAVVSFQDISQRRASEEELRRSNAELEQFAYAISHDMRQPLRMVSSYLQLLERGIGDSLDDEQRRFLNYAGDGARRMDAMILGLLEYSRVGRKTEPMALFATREALDTALAFLRPAMEESGGEVAVEGEWPQLVASRDEMVRLLQNLVGNALKYVAADTRPAITVVSQVTPGIWEVRIGDNGVGVDPAQRDRLFQVFSRLHTREEYEGSGIGLALCRRIVEHHGGDIGFESEGPGCGSTFWFRIPRTQQGVNG